MQSQLRQILASSVGRLPTRVRSGVAVGARWTLYPCSSYWRGTHEPPVQEALCQMGGGDIRGWACWDLGAHYGLYSVGLGLRVGPSGQVAGFEPNPASFRRLELHRSLNHLHWLKTFQAAASDHTGTADLLTYGLVDSTEAHLQYRGETLGAECTPVPVQTLRLDELVEQGTLRLPSFVKMDIEGHAHLALLGMRNSITRARPRFIIGFHSPEEVQGVLSILDLLGYRRETLTEPLSQQETLIGGDYLFSP